MSFTGPSSMAQSLSYVTFSSQEWWAFLLCCTHFLGPTNMHQWFRLESADGKLSSVCWSNMARSHPMMRMMRSEFSRLVGGMDDISGRYVVKHQGW